MSESGESLDFTGRTLTCRALIGGRAPPDLHTLQSHSILNPPDHSKIMLQ